MTHTNYATNGAQPASIDSEGSENNQTYGCVNDNTLSPALVADVNQAVHNDWVLQTIENCIERGYRPIPYFENKAAPFGEGQKYPVSDRRWYQAKWVAVALDNNYLVDWDHNKKTGVMQLDDLANALGMTREQLDSAEVQTNDKGDSKHYLFKRGCSMDGLKHSNDGNTYKGIDFKTGNQLMHIKQHKTLNLPHSNDLPLATPEMIELVRNTKKNSSDYSHEDTGGFEEWTQDLLEAESIHGALIRVVGSMVARGWADKDIRFTFGLLADKVRAARGKERANLMLGSELEGAIKGARDKGFAPVSFEDLKAQAEDTDTDTPTDEIADIVRGARSLNAIERRRVFEVLRRKTKLPFETLKELIREEKQDQEESHLDIARALIEKVGADNILMADSFAWGWQSTGVWEKIEERSIRQLIQQQLQEDPELVKGKIDSISDLFKTEIFKPYHEFNVGAPECVNTLNGELVLVDYEWQLQPANREHYRTTQIPVDYDAEAIAPRFQQFLNEVFKGDSDSTQKRQALLEMMGYSLMAHCRYEMFIILVGSGANGKSVILSVLEALLGSKNVAGVQPSQFDQSFKRAHLHNKLANIVTEIKQGEVIDDASLKGIVSGEPTTVEHKFKDPFDMRPFSTCWFGTNHMPHTRDFSNALFRRALILEFNNTFKPELGNCDPLLKDRLLDELPGILNLALTAYGTALALEDFTLPDSCKEARARWRLEADQVAQFIEDACICESDKRSEPQNLYNNYRYWANQAGIHKTVSLKTFMDRLTVLGFERAKSNGKRYLKGVGVRSEYSRSVYY